MDIKSTKPRVLLAVELKTKVHPKIRNDREGPY